jgi:RNA polymerase primary sigma factor
VSRPSAPPPEVLPEVPADVLVDVPVDVPIDFPADLDLDERSASVEAHPPADDPAKPEFTTDPIRMYIKAIGRGTLLTAADEVELAQRIEAGLFAGERLAAAGLAGGRLPEQVRRDLETSGEGRRAGQEPPGRGQPAPGRLDGVDRWRSGTSAGDCRCST